MIKNVRLVIPSIALFLFSLFLASNAFAESYIDNGNKVIKKIYGDILLLKKNHSALKAFGETALNKSPRDEYYIAFGEPVKKTGEKETIYISYSKFPMSFKTWECAPGVFYSLEYGLYVGYCLQTKEKLRQELLKIIEKDVR